MKIDFIMLSFGIGGAESRISKVVSKVIADGLDARLIINSSLAKKATDRKDFKEALDSIVDKNRMKRLPELSFKSVGRFIVFVYSLFYFFLSKSSHCHLSLGAIYLSIFSLFVRKKVVVEVTSPDVARKLVKISRAIPKKVTFLCVSETVYKIVSSHFTGNVSLKYPVPYFIEKNFDVIKKKKQIAFSARFIERKNPILFLESIIELSKMRDDFSVVMMGAGPLDNEVNSLASKLPPAIDLKLGFISDPLSVLKESLVFVSLIQPDNFPSQSVLEAMNCENVLVLSDTGSSNLFLEQDQLDLPNGCLVELDKVKIATCLNELLSNQERTKFMGVNSRKRLKRFFNPDIFVSYLITSLKSMR